MAKMKVYVCDYCKVEYIKSRSESECIAEAKDLFPNENKLCIVCEDCFIKIMDFHEPGKKRYDKYVTDKPFLETYYEAWVDGEKP